MGWPAHGPFDFPVDKGHPGQGLWPCPSLSEETSRVRKEAKRGQEPATESTCAQGKGQLRSWPFLLFLPPQGPGPPFSLFYLVLRAHPGPRIPRRHTGEGYLLAALLTPARFEFLVAKP